jgi:hypothetical protein
MHKSGMVRLFAWLPAVRRRGILHCSFCGRDENEVERLVAGASGHICSACIVQCVSILQHHGGFDMPEKPR